jgi:hypothetical protein
MNSVPTPGWHDQTPSPGPTPLSPTRRVILWLELVISMLLTLLFGFAACQSFAEAGRRGHTVGGGVVLVFMTLATGWWLARVLYRLHHPYAGLRTLGVPGSLLMPRTSSGRMRKRHSPRYTRNLALTFAVMGLVPLALVPSGIAHTERSSYVQTHGLLSTGTVTSVNNDQSCSRGGCWWTSQIRVDLSVPVGGVTTTTIHTPFASSLRTGESTTFLVDPSDPSWSEIPGARFDGAGAWIGLVVVLGFFWLLAGWCLFLWRRAVRRTAYGATVGLTAP